MPTAKKGAGAAKPLVVVDTHLWIEYFGQKNNASTREIENLLRQKRVAVLGPIAYELMIGPRSKGDVQYLLGCLRGALWLQTTEAVWLKAVDLAREANVMASDIPDLDVLIAAHCLVHGCALFSRDGHFDSFPGLRRHKAVA